MDHLIDVHGCRRIAFLRGPEGNEDSEWRERGYLQALANHGIAFDPALVGNGGYDEDLAQGVVQAWLQDGLSLDAIFAGDDDAALGALAALRRAGVRVPQDVAVVGFDDVTLSRHVMPPLTTVRSPIEQVGRQAVLQLVKCIHNEPVEPVTLLRTELVIRQSCGCS